MDDPRHASRLHATQLRHGADLFDAGAWWDAHEAWEAVWKTYPGSDRAYLKGLIQLAAVNHHLASGRTRGARRLLDTASHHLGEADPLRWPFDTAHLLTACAGIARALDAGRAVRPLRLGLAAMIAAASTNR